MTNKVKTFFLFIFLAVICLILASIGASEVHLGLFIALSTMIVFTAARIAVHRRYLKELEKAELLWNDYQRIAGPGISPEIKALIERILHQSPWVVICDIGAYRVLANPYFVQFADKLPVPIERVFGKVENRPEASIIRDIVPLNVNLSDCLLAFGTSFAPDQNYYILSSPCCCTYTIYVERVYFDYLKSQYPDSDVFFSRNGGVFFILEKTICGYICGYA